MVKLVDGEEFLIHAEENICYVVLNSPSTKNAISLRMSHIMQSLSFNFENKKSTFEEFLINYNCVLIVLKSAVTGVFSSGGNLKDLKNNSLEDCQQYGASIRSFCNLLNSISIPSVAILSGPSYGGGVELALATDFRWSVGKNYDFHLSQTRFGIPAGWNGMLRLTELCPNLYPKKVAALQVGKCSLTSTQLLRLGLVDQTFTTAKSCQQNLIKWKDNIIDCPKPIRDNLMNRQKILNKSLLYEYDINIFNKYFLKEEHKKRIHNFFSVKSK
ncbi:enoyl-CoA hydratase/isomerase family protein [Spirobacillus cienkowskii]|uniref:enoyl-CoA hydratase/isomerase family protein n=1 Tax=Spirobacillus cienkowskii TaxID=495820 RepID=UPI0030D493DE